VFAAVELDDGAAGAPDVGAGPLLVVQHCC
jgi:hypothetical protein